MAKKTTRRNEDNLNEILKLLALFASLSSLFIGIIYFSGFIIFTSFIQNYFGYISISHFFVPAPILVILGFLTVVLTVVLIYVFIFPGLFIKLKTYIFQILTIPILIVFFGSSFSSIIIYAIAIIVLIPTLILTGVLSEKIDNYIYKHNSLFRDNEFKDVLLFFSLTTVCLIIINITNMMDLLDKIFHKHTVLYAVTLDSLFYAFIPEIILIGILTSTLLGFLFIRNRIKKTNYLISIIVLIVTVYGFSTMIGKSIANSYKYTNVGIFPRFAVLTKNPTRYIKGEQKENQLYRSDLYLISKDEENYYFFEGKRLIIIPKSEISFLVQEQ